MLRLSFALLAAALVNVSIAQNETEIEAAVQFLFPNNYCVSPMLTFSSSCLTSLVHGLDTQFGI